MYIDNKELDEVLDAYGWFDPNPSNTNKLGVAGTKVGEIRPGDLFVRFSNDGSETAPQGDSVHKVLFRNNNGKVRYGYIQEYMEAEKYSTNESARFGMEAFYYSKFNPDTNKIEDQTLNIKNNEFILSRDLKYISVSGKNLGILKAGTIVRGGGYAGMSHPDYMSFSEKYNEESESWIPVDQKNNSRAYICLDMENGVNGYFRSLW